VEEDKFVEFLFKPTPGVAANLIENFQTPMRALPLIAALLAFLFLSALCPASLGQQSAASPSPTPAQLTTLPAGVLDAELKSARGLAFKLSDYSGKVLVINLWATWLGPSRMEIPELVKLQSRFWSRGVRVVGLSTEDPKESIVAVRAFVRNYQIQYKVGWAPPNVAQTLIQGQEALPQTYIISGTGRIVRRFVGFNPQKAPTQFEEAIEEALKDSPQSTETAPARQRSRQAKNDRPTRR